jgi:hypothetical protein
MNSNMPELRIRLSALRELAARLTADERWLSTPLREGDDLVEKARACRTPIVDPLTIGTLLASVLGEVDSVESAIESLKRNERPGEDEPDPVAMWQRQASESTHAR